MSRFSNFQRHCLSVAISQALLVPMVVQSATVEVDTVLDDNNPVGCSLREAVQTINTGLSTNNDCNAIGVFGANDQINFNLPSNSTITLSGTRKPIVRRLGCIKRFGTERLAFKIKV